MKNIALIGLKYHNNIGDALAMKCTKYLIEKNNNDINIIELDMYGRYCREKEDSVIIQESSKDKIKALITKFKLQELFNIYKEIRYCIDGSRKRAVSFYSKQLLNIDAVIIVAAGTIKYDKTDDFGLYYDIITKIAYRYKIPCLISAAGIESSYNGNDFRCRRFQKAINRDNVLLITCRDNLSELKKYINNVTIPVYSVADPAVWAAKLDCNGIKHFKREKIGISVITFQRFIQYNSKIDKYTYESTICSLMRELSSKGIEWRLFSNGHSEDTDYAIELCKKAGFTNTELYMLPPPVEPEDLTDIISQFSLIITARLHACIVAYSLGIPFIAFNWSDKIKLFAQKVGLGDYIIDDNLSCGNIYNLIEKLEDFKYDDKEKKIYKESIEDSLNDFIHKVKAFDKKDEG